MRHPGQDEHQVDAPLGRVLQGGAQGEEVQRWTTTLYICQLYNLSPPHMLFLSAVYYKHVTRPVKSDKYLVFILHQHPSQSAHVQ